MISTKISKELYIRHSIVTLAKFLFYINILAMVHFEIRALNHIIPLLFLLFEVMGLSAMTAQNDTLFP
jgi:hypothetical protein